MKPPYRSVYISDHAYRNLCYLTMEKRYSNHSYLEDVTRLRGTHLLIQAVFEANQNPENDWFDSRPDFLRAQSKRDPYSPDPTNPIILEAWQDFEDEPRSTARSMKITDTTIRQILQIATHFGIRSNRHAASRRSSNPLARVGMTLEAWGNKYLLPKTIPMNPNSLAHHKEFVDRLAGNTRGEPAIYY